MCGIGAKVGAGVGRCGLGVGVNWCCVGAGVGGCGVGALVGRCDESKGVWWMRVV